MKKIALILFFLFLTGRGWSQELLNATESQIKTYMKGQNGILKSRENAKLGGIDFHEIMLFYTFSNESMKTNDIFSVSFFLTKLDKCRRYAFTYLTDKHLNEVLKDIFTRNSGLTRIGNELKWVNYLKSYDIELIKAAKNSKVTSFTLVYTYQNEGMMN